MFRVFEVPTRPRVEWWSTFPTLIVYKRHIWWWLGGVPGDVVCFYIIKFWKCPTTPPCTQITPLRDLGPNRCQQKMIGLYTFDVGKLLHHSALPDFPWLRDRPNIEHAGQPHSHGYARQ